MDGLVLALFLLSLFFGGIVSGLAGFAMGLVVSGIWLHILTPAQTAALIVGYGLLVQSYSIWKLRHALRWRTVAPFIAGGMIGVPLGAALLTTINPAYLRHRRRCLAGGVQRLFPGHAEGSHGPGRRSGRYRHRHHQRHPRRSDGTWPARSLRSGVSCGAGAKTNSGRSSSRSSCAAFVLTAVSLTVNGTVTADLIRLYLMGLPVLIAGVLVGLKLYGHLDDAAFRKVILYLLLVSGLVLIAPIVM